tara:strand:+ start:154 stop:369 length:216 start_codon:yes stop_codon:yes gene_type:complete
MSKVKTNIRTIQSALQDVLDANDYKEGTKKAAICETSFIQGAITADPTLISNCPILSICLMSGRSILSLNR